MSNGPSQRPQSQGTTWWGGLLAVAFVAVATAESASSADLAGPQWLNGLCAAAMAVPLATGRRYPTAAVAAAAAAATVQTIWLTPSTDLAMPFLAMLIAAYTAGRYAPHRRVALILLGLCLAEEWTGPIAVNRDPVWDGLFVSLALWAVWLLGRSFLTRANLAQAERARLEAEWERATQIRRAVTAERHAVARDLHDTVAHAVTLMVLQATGSRLIARKDPAAAAAAMASIEKAGRQAMDDLRAMLHVLRQEPDGRPAPPPTLEQLNALVETARSSGVDAVLDTSALTAELPRPLAVTAYRTVQEGLTNAARHAPGAPVGITLRTTPRQLTVTVTNAPAPGDRSSPTTGSGTGLAGLRERVTALGGVLTAGPQPDGGYALAATLPRSPA
ncbi:sensor histidine kinase [Krasilnikovia cinnamomea]|uniref:sensor histidine kinase n=1 Tax=Krasilnikovia cinnamomea TaxID=349313 RepID=UPI0013EF3D85|nr:histidine kinase [Krasilnikovia cinnamomea]